MARVRTQYQDKMAHEQVIEYSKQHSNTGDGSLHKTYKNFFSLVDVADGYWYATVESHSFQHWTAKMLISIMKFFIDNMWSLYCSKKATTIHVFRRKVAEVLAEWC